MLYDVLIIGSGIAGLSAALDASRFGLKVAVVTKTNPFRSNSSMASGGINAALGSMEADTPDDHIGDTVKSGKGLVEPKATAYLCEQAPEAIMELEKLGVGFDKTPDGKISQRPFGGAGKKRTCYVADKTGGAIVQTLLGQCRKAGVEFLADYYLLNLIVKDNRVRGITVLRQKDSTTMAFAAKAVILAAGGYAGIYQGHSTNPRESVGDALAVAMRAGLRLANMEFVQFHPTGLAKNGALLSEAARGEGGKLVLEDGTRFVNELATRDELARAIAGKLEEGQQVYLDLRHLDPEVIETKLPSLKRACMAGGGIDPATELIPIKAVAHYTMGGIETEPDTSTAIDGLYACGECAWSGAHGANRLGGNSLLEGAVFGAKAGREAARFAKKRDYLEIDYSVVARDMNMVDSLFEGESRYNLNSLRNTLGKVMYEKCGVFRNENKLADAYDYLEYLRGLRSGVRCVTKSRDQNVEVPMILSFFNALDVAEVTVLSAMERKESRGAHCRRDYPETDEKNFGRNTYVAMQKTGFFSISNEKSGGLDKWARKIKSIFINN